LSRGISSGWNWLTSGFGSPNDFSSGMSYSGQVRPDTTDYMGGGFYGYD